MGVIRKKTAARGGEGGVKYVCDVCSADITSTVRFLFLLPASKPCPAHHPGTFKSRATRGAMSRCIRTCVGVNHLSSLDPPEHN